MRKQRLCYGCWEKPCNQRLESQLVRHKWMYQKAQPIAALRKPNGQGKSRCQRELCNNKSNTGNYHLSSYSSRLNPEWQYPAKNICFPR